MSPTFKPYFLFFILFLFFGCEKPPVNWFPSYDSKDTMPFGTFVLRQELGNIFPDSNITNIETKTYDYLNEIYYQNKKEHYIYIYPENSFDDKTWKKILDYVNRGGTAFISMIQSNPVFEKELEIKIKGPEKIKDVQKVSISVKKPNSEVEYILDKGAKASYFSAYNDEYTEVLGYVTYQNTKRPNFIKVYHGNGYILIQTEPVAFTNYYMLKDNHFQYAVNVFSYLGNEDILWDNHRMFYRGNDKKNEGGFFSALQFLMKHPSLRWALFLLIIMGILYLVFNSKRRQKAVPILLPYANYTLDFAKTLSELYRYNTNHTALTKYKINYFLEQIKINYNITAKDTEKDFSELLSAKSGVELSICKRLVSTLEFFRNKTYLDKEDFFKLQSLIESFNFKSNYYGRKSS